MLPQSRAQPIIHIPEIIHNIHTPSAIQNHIIDRSITKCSIRSTHAGMLHSRLRSMLNNNTAKKVPLRFVLFIMFIFKRKRQKPLSHNTDYALGARLSMIVLTASSSRVKDPLVCSHQRASWNSWSPDSDWRLMRGISKDVHLKPDHV